MYSTVKFTPAEMLSMIARATPAKASVHPRIPNLAADEEGNLYGTKSFRQSKKTGHPPIPMCPCPVGKGYHRVLFPSLEGSGARYIHRLVLEAFVGMAPAGTECAHLNGNRTDNRLANLQWTTRSVNFSHKRLHGTAGAGEKSTQAKLKDVQCLSMQQAFLDGATVPALAKEYNVCQGTVFNVLNGRRMTADGVFLKAVRELRCVRKLKPATQKPTTSLDNRGAS
jgi:hypothetical protein